MEELNEEALQNLVEKQMRNSAQFEDGFESDNIKLYSIIFSELKNNVPLNKNGSIAEKVVARIRGKAETADHINYSMIIFAIIILVLGLVYSALVITNNAILTSIENLIDSHKGIYTFIVFAFCMIQVADKYLGKKHSTDFPRT